MVCLAQAAAKAGLPGPLVWLRIAECCIALATAPQPHAPTNGQQNAADSPPLGDAVLMNGACVIADLLSQLGWGGHETWMLAWYHCRMRFIYAMTYPIKKVGDVLFTIVLDSLD